MAQFLGSVSRCCLAVSLLVDGWASVSISFVAFVVVGCYCFVLVLCCCVLLWPVWWSAVVAFVVGCYGFAASLCCCLFSFLVGAWWVGCWVVHKCDQKCRGCMCVKC